MIDSTRIKDILLGSGASVAGFAAAGRVSAEYERIFDEWLKKGNYAGMEYMTRYRELRMNPELLLPDAKTVISVAFNFKPPRFRSSDKEIIACYAYGKDYHDVIRKRLKEVVSRLSSDYGGEYRICVDTAPVAERYWAVKAGIGFRGRNGQVIIPGTGGMVFLAEIITTLGLPPDEPLLLNCKGCDACQSLCPAGALKPDSTIDARYCLSYLTIEHRGEWNSPEALKSLATTGGKSSLYGCDLCLRVCPHNLTAPATSLQDFYPSGKILTLSASDIRGMTPESFAETFRHSAVKRAKLEGLQRNAANILGGAPGK